MSRFRFGYVAGLDHLIGLWDELAAAVDGGWTSRQGHHDRLLNLLGHKAASAPADLEAARASTALLNGPDPAAAAALRSLCAGRIADLRAERSQYCDLPEYRARLIDVAIAPTSKEAQLLHRYEREHERALYAAIRGLLALEKSGADLPEPEAEAAPAPAAPENHDTSHETKKTCVELASVGEPAPAGGRSGAAEASPGRPGRPEGPIGADPRPGSASKQR